jgi:hypothetical protein
MNGDPIYQWGTPTVNTTPSMDGVVLWVAIYEHDMVMVGVEHMFHQSSMKSACFLVILDYQGKQSNYDIFQYSVVNQIAQCMYYELHFGYHDI